MSGPKAPIPPDTSDMQKATGRISWLFAEQVAREGHTHEHEHPLLGVGEAFDDVGPLEVCEAE